MQHPPFIVPSAIYNEIIAHARQGKPEEICGLLRGRENRAAELVRGRNVATDKINNYEVDPQTLLRQFEFEEAGDQMVAIYHSHPVSEAYPSATDAWSAHYPDAYYLICSLADDDAPTLRAFKLVAQFPELDVETLRQQLEFNETRPGLFGYFQPSDQTVADPLQEIAETVAPPFYIVFTVDEAGAVADHRVVPVREHPVQIQG